MSPQSKGNTYDSSTNLVEQLALKKEAILLPGYVFSV
jgi:hypothetical protein